MNLNEQQQESVAAIRDLIGTGDIKPAIAKNAYRIRCGKNTTLTDEQMVTVYASQDDDYGDDDIVKRMIALEEGKDLNWVGEQA